jgi:phosphotransferase system HPr (HPr) family protein
MMKATVKITDPMGVHVRHCGAIAQFAAQHDATVFLKHAGKRADARQPAAVLGLAIPNGGVVEVEAEGTAAETALAAVCAALPGNRLEEISESPLEWALRKTGLSGE